MKNIISKSLQFSLLLMCTFGTLLLQAQTTVSKSCGKCHKPVSQYATIGDVCPHCGVRWGYENTSKTTSTRTVDYSLPSPSDYDMKLPSYDNSDFMFQQSNTVRNSNLRSAPSKDSEVMVVLPKNASITITKKLGDWVKISYIGNLSNEQFNIQTYTGWLHISNVVF